MIKKITNIKGTPVEFSLSGVPYTKACFGLPAVLEKLKKNPDDIVRMDDAVFCLFQIGTYNFKLLSCYVTGVVMHCAHLLCS